MCEDGGQRGGARVDVLDRGAIEADAHHAASGDERPALAVEDRRPRVGVADRPQAASGGQARVDDASGAQTTFQCPSRRSSATRVRYDHAPIPGTSQRSRTVARAVSPLLATSCALACTRAPSRPRRLAASAAAAAARIAR